MYKNLHICEILCTFARFLWAKSKTNKINYYYHATNHLETWFGSTDGW